MEVGHLQPAPLTQAQVERIRDLTFFTLDSLEFEGREYRAFLPVSEDDEEPYEMILFRVVEEDGEELLEVIDDEDEMERVYASFMERLFDDDEDVD